MEFSEAFIRILLAGFLGSLIGIEREYRDKSAGFRTMILIAVGSALFTIIAFSVSQTLVDIDPTRIASSVVGGVGFLGAGVILKDGTSIKGLTTASTIWLSASLGVGAGSGFFAITLFAAIIVLSALIVLPPLEHWIDSRHEYRHYEIQLKHQDDYQKTMELLRGCGLKVFRSRRGKQSSMFLLIADVDGKGDAHARAEERLCNAAFVKAF